MRSDLADTFRHDGVADAYRHRPPYPSEVFEILDKLTSDEPRNVLDLGAGEGALARPLADRMDRVDAVDVSAAMVNAGRSRPGGRRPNLRWTVGHAETCDLDGPYSLVTAGASLHWMDWQTLMARLETVMSEHAYLVVVEHGPRDVGRQEQLVEVIVRHSRSPDYDPQFSVVDALIDRGLFEVAGRAETAAVRFQQPVEAYVEQFHSTSSLAREHMTAAESAEFDSAVEAIVRPRAVNGMLELSIVATLAWGRPSATGFGGPPPSSFTL